MCRAGDVEPEAQDNSAGRVTGSGSRTTRLQKLPELELATTRNSAKLETQRPLTRKSGQTNMINIWEGAYASVTPGGTLRGIHRGQGAGRITR